MVAGERLCPAAAREQRRGHVDGVAHEVAIFEEHEPAILARITKATDAQKTSWFEGSTGERARRIAADTGLTALMTARGYTAAQQNACLDDGVAQAELTGMTNIGRNADHVTGTPSFFINGRNAEVTAWPAIKSKLDLALKAP